MHEQVSREVRLDFPGAGIDRVDTEARRVRFDFTEIELVPLVARESRLVRALAGFDSSGLTPAAPVQKKAGRWYREYERRKGS